MIGRSHPITLGPSTTEDISTRTWRLTPSRLARRATVSSKESSAGVPRLARDHTSLQPHSSRTEKRTTPRDQAGRTHDWSRMTGGAFEVDGSAEAGFGDTGETT